MAICPKHRRRLANRKTRYGITEEEFQLLWKKCKGKCMLCDQPMEPTGNKGTAVCVDHDHSSGLVRGLLHKKCNSALGYFDDDVNKLVSAVQYLLRHLTH